MSTTVTVPIDDFDALRNRITELELDLATVRLELGEMQATARAADDPSALDALRNLASNVIRFAVQNLPPEHVKGWPHADLKAFAAFVLNWPGSTDHDKELASELLLFADECAVLEAARPPLRGRPPGPPARPEDYGGQTEEAKAVVAARAQRDST